MTREEEIKQAARIRADQYSHPTEWNACYRHFSQGARWADRTLIEKACEWLQNWASLSVNDTTDSLDEEDLVKRFKKAMENNGNSL